ncbi:MAG: TolC family protein [Flavobacteriales bacterium]|nr:TolC family protein [Flavobacteriales bacterium]
MRTTQKILCVLSTCFMLIKAPAQNNKTAFSLQEAIDFALQNNVNAINASKDIEKGRHLINENIGSGLVQINASAQYNYNIKPPVFIFPNVLGPNPDPNQFVAINAAPLNSMNASATASMVVVSGQYFIGIQTAKTFLELTKQQKIKTDREVKEQVYKTYYLVLIAGESERILDSSLKIINRSVFETEQLHKEGLIEALDVEQLRLIQYNTQDAYNQIKQSKELALISLKYQMGYPMEKEIQLTDNLENLIHAAQFEGLISSLTDSIDVRSNIDYKLISQKLLIDKKQIQLQRAAAYPSLSTFFTVGGNFFNNERWLFLGEGTSSNLNGVIWGFQLNVPIFSSWSRVSKLQQLKIEMQKTQNLQRNVERGLQLGYHNAKTQVTNNYKRYLTAKKGFELAEKIRRVNNIKYREGLISSLNLSQSEQQYFESQQKYFQAVFELLNAKIELDKSMNKF